jgi:hypothetical protein
MTSHYFVRLKYCFSLEWTIPGPMFGTELHHCIASGLLERVKQLVNGGANINMIDDGHTALMLACACGRNSGDTSIVEYLVGKGANVAIKNVEGMTAVLCSAARSVDLVKYLIEHGGSLTDRCSKGRTLLHYAVRRGSLPMVKYLLSSEGGANISEIDGDGCTALLLAEEPMMVKWLLEYGGADITDVDNMGRSVWGCPSFPSFTLYRTESSEMFRTMVLHEEPPAWLLEELPGSFKRIAEDGERLRARLPAHLAQRRIFVDSHCCHLLSPLLDLVHGYAELTTDELWATKLHKK